MNPATIKVSKAMPAIAAGIEKMIETIAGRAIGFGLLVFTDERASYISSTPRAEFAKALTDTLARWEQGTPPAGTTDYATLQLTGSLRTMTHLVDKSITMIAGKPIAFSLIVFTEPHACYAGMISRPDFIREARDLLDYWAQGMPDIKAHEVVA
jgi:hypothetical protein